MKPEEIVVGAFYIHESGGLRTRRPYRVLARWRDGTVTIRYPGLFRGVTMPVQQFAAWATRRLDTPSSEGGAHG